MSSRRKGLSLIEVLVASGVLTAVLLPLLLLLSQTVRGTEMSLDEIRATNLAAELLEQMQVLPGSVGWNAFNMRPEDNLPPRFPKFLSLDPKGSELPIEGHLFDLPLATGGAGPTLATEGWTKVGAAYCFDPAPGGDPLVAERSRLFLSPCPEGFTRFVQTHHPLIEPGSGAYDPLLTKIVVRVEFEENFSGGSKRKRRIHMSTLVSAPWR